jgi:hypothetical protein
MYWTQPFVGIPPWNLDQLKPYMFNVAIKDNILDNNPEYKDDIDTETKQIESQAIIEPVKECNVYDRLKSNTISVGKCVDSLFWSLFLAKYGYSEYKRIGLHNGKVENKEKQDIADHFLKEGAKSLSSILNHKLTKTGSIKIIENLLTLPKTPYSSLYAFAFYYEMNIYLVDVNKKIYIEFTHQTKSVQNIILYKNPNKGQPTYFIDLNESVYSVNYIGIQYLRLVNETKPLMAASHYKVADLENLASILGIKIDGKIKKTELYEKIALHCVWE